MTRRRVYDIGLDAFVWVGEAEPEPEPKSEVTEDVSVVEQDWRNRRYPPSIGRYVPNKRHNE